MNFFCYVILFISVLFSFNIIYQVDPLKILLNFLFFIFSLSLFCFSFNSIFIGVLEILIYIGAIVVLFSFFIIVLNLSESSLQKVSQICYRDMIFSLFKSVLCVLFFLVFFISFFLMNDSFIEFNKVFSIKEIGISLFSEKYFFFIEFFSLYLFIGLLVVLRFFLKKKLIKF